MIRIVEINTGEIATGGKDAIIKTSGIGSCVVVSLYDEKKRIGGMLHAMLPTRKNISSNQGFITAIREDDFGKYVDESIIHMVDEIEKSGSNRNDLKAKIVGGASMFQIFSNSKIGFENIKAAKKILQILNIPIINEEVGGQIGRSATLYMGNGILEVLIKM